MSSARLDNWMSRMPVVAILRGVRPEEAVDVANAVYEAGIGVIEIPLNSPDPLTSIRSVVGKLGSHCVIGAGTVLQPDAVSAVADAGGSIVVSPNTNVTVIKRSVELGLTPMPGWATASEAFAALDAGARYLKLFPAATYGPAHVRACRAILPDNARILAVGGAGADDIDQWLAAGVSGFGIGSELYKAGRSAESVGKRAASIVAAYRNATAS